MTEIDDSEAIQKLFEKAYKNCTCNFNLPVFKAALSEYIGLRLAVHRDRKAHGRVKHDLVNRVTIARHRIENLAPCRDCVARYNPTGRQSGKIWNPHRNRAYREALQ